MKATRIAICLAATALLCPAEEFESPVKDGTWVADRAGMMSAQYGDRIADFVKRLNRRTGAQLVVVTVQRVDPPMAPRAFATALFNRWGLGRAKANDGVLLFVSRDDRAVEIVTGRGLKAQLPDARVQALIQSKLLPGLARGEAGPTLLEGVKDIGATLAGIDRTGPPLPDKTRPIYLYLTLAGAAAGLWGCITVLRFWLHPLPLPPTGRRQETKHWADGKIRASTFATNKARDFFEQQASSLLPEGWRKYPPVALWVTVVGFTLLGGGGSALLLAAISRDMEFGFWRVAALAGVCCIGTLCALALPEIDRRPDRWNLRWCAGIVLRALAITLVVGSPIGYVAALKFWPDRLVAAYIAPLWAIAVNAGFGVFLARNLRWYPRKTACNLCRTELLELEQEALPGVLKTWEQQARQHGVVYFRGWRCPTCHPNISSDGVYLAYAVDGDDRFCGKCKQPSIARTTRKKSLVSHCLICGSQTSKKATFTTGVAAAAVYESSSYSSSGSDDNSDDYTPWIDTSGPSVDTGGGSTDGGGGGGTW